MSTLVDHAKKELELRGEEPDTVDWYLTVVHAFSAFGHTGGSATDTIPIIMLLLERKNLTPLTNNPEEWTRVRKNVWQNCRLTEAFSHDGGRHYWLLSEGGNEEHPYPQHKSVDHKKR